MEAWKKTYAQSPLQWNFKCVHWRKSKKVIDLNTDIVNRQNSNGLKKRVTEKNITWYGELYSLRYVINEFKCKLRNKHFFYSKRSELIKPIKSINCVIYFVLWCGDVHDDVEYFSHRNHMNLSTSIKCRSMYCHSIELDHITSLCASLMC